MAKSSSTASSVFRVAPTIDRQRAGPIARPRRGAEQRRVAASSLRHISPELEQRLGGELRDAFDLIVGTSRGGIIGLGLAAGLRPAEMLHFYIDHGPEIFKRRRRFPITLFRPRYNREPLDRILRERFGETRMNDLSKPVCITAHELVAGTTRVWKDDHHPSLSGGGDLPVWLVAAATAAAPTYFAPIRVQDSDSHVDGGVWANNPALVGITEAVRYFERPSRRSVYFPSEQPRASSASRLIERPNGWAWWGGQGKPWTCSRAPCLWPPTDRRCYCCPTVTISGLTASSPSVSGSTMLTLASPLRERGAQEARQTVGKVPRLLVLEGSSRSS